MFPIVIANKFKKILQRLWTKWERFYAYGLFVWFKVLAHLVQLIWSLCSLLLLQLDLWTEYPCVNFSLLMQYNRHRFLLHTVPSLIFLAFFSSSLLCFRWSWREGRSSTSRPWHWVTWTRPGRERSFLSSTDSWDLCLLKTQSPWRYAGNVWGETWDTAGKVDGLMTLQRN